MVVEENVRKIVEQVLLELTREKEGTGASCQTSKAIPADDDNSLGDMTQLDLQRDLQVPNPVNKRLYEDMKMATPARIGVWRSGPRPLTGTLLRFRADHAMAQDAVLGEVPDECAEKCGMVSIKTMCADKDEYLTRPDLGRRLGEEALNAIRKGCSKGAKVQVIVSDGLSSKAVEANAPDLLPALAQGLESLGVKLGTPIFVKYGRVAVMDVIGEELKPEVAVILIGERPGLGMAKSMSAYIGYNPRVGMIESERTVISNIYQGGTPAAEAGAHLATLIKKVLDTKISGMDLER